MLHLQRVSLVQDPDADFKLQHLPLLAELTLWGPGSTQIQHSSSTASLLLSLIAWIPSRLILWLFVDIYTIFFITLFHFLLFTHNYLYHHTLIVCSLLPRSDCKEFKHNAITHIYKYLNSKRKSVRFALWKGEKWKQIIPLEGPSHWTTVEGRSQTASASGTGGTRGVGTELTSSSTACMQGSLFAEDHPNNSTWAQ